MNSGTGARRRAALCVCLVASLAVLTGAPALHGQEFMAVAQEMPGFKPTSSYQDFGNGESVNLANGGLTVTHASAVGLPQNMGDTLRPVRVYNTKNPGASFDATCAQTDNAIACGPLGGGWRISYGRVFLRVANASRISPVGCVSRSQYYYQDESGAEHRLYLDSTLERYAGANTKPNGSNWYVTNDLSFIRARYSTLSNEWTLYFPDGSTRVAGGAAGLYVAPVPGPVYSNGDGTTYVSGLTNNRTNGWWVRSITDRAGNAIGISYYAVDAAHKYPAPFAPSRTHSDGPSPSGMAPKGRSSASRGRASWRTTRTKTRRFPSIPAPFPSSPGSAPPRGPRSPTSTDSPRTRARRAST